MTGLQRLAMQTAGYPPAPKPPKPSQRNFRQSVVDVSDIPLTPRRETESSKNPPPMFENPAKERRGTRLTHVKGTSPQQLAKFRNQSQDLAGGLRRINSGSTQNILSLDDLYKAILSIDLTSADESTDVVVEVPDDPLRYESLQEYKARQSQILLVETMEGLKQSLTSGFVPVNLAGAPSSGLFQCLNVRLTTAVRKGREWCLLTVKKEIADRSNDKGPELTQGDILLLLKPKSKVLEGVLRYGFNCPLSPNVLSEKGSALFGIVDKTKTSLVVSKQAKSVQLRCSLASKDAPLGYSPSEGQTINSEWVGVIIHSVLTVEREWKSLCALTSKSSFVEALLGKPLQLAVPVQQPVQSVKSLNQFQRDAIGAAVSGLNSHVKSSNIVLIQGPPGTGKTHTLVSLLQVLESKKIQKVLISAPSNAAVDELMARFITACPLLVMSNVLRVGRNSRPDLKAHSLDQMVVESQTKTEQERHLVYKEKKNKIHDDIQRINAEISNMAGGQRKSELIRTKERLKDQLDNMKAREEESVKVERDSIYKRFLNRAQFIFGTLSAFGADVIFNNLTDEVDMCLIDEAAQALEVSSLIPLRFDPKRVVLVGDPQQLSAVVKSVAAKRARLDLSLFERLQLIGNHPTYMLREQYRMHSVISDFSSKYFYEGKLVTADSVAGRSPHQAEAVLASPMVFIDVASANDMKQGTSVINPREGRLTSELARFLVNTCGVSSIGVISPYRQQVHLIRNLLTSLTAPGLEVDSVDAFQGREKDVILFNCVRSGGSNGGVGFLSDQRRLNVAITRAKRAVWIVGNANFLRNHGGPVWESLVDHCERLGALIPASVVEQSVLESQSHKRQRTSSH